jgi:transcription factor IIIB subunit 2
MHSTTEVICTICGKVNEGTQMVNELSFGESSSGAAMVHGSFLNADQTSTSRGLYGHSGNSRSLTIDKARNQMMGVAHNLKIPESTVQQAVAHYKRALHKGFVKGRKSRFVTSACLYLACRLHKTSHMLLNFSSLLYVNIYVLGSTYLQLVRCLEIDNIPPIDPTLFVQRFVSKIDFPTESDGRKVMKDAIRLVQRMNKDWITEGRRPAGVAAASVLLACRMNNFRRSKLQIMQLAMISEGTIDDRLKEFRNTDAATLTIRDFRATNVDSAADPPSFTRNKERQRQEEAASLQRAAEDPLDNPEIRELYNYVMEATEKEAEKEKQQEEEDRAEREAQDKAEKEFFKAFEDGTDEAASTITEKETASEAPQQTTLNENTNTTKNTNEATENSKDNANEATENSKDNANETIENSKDSTDETDPNTTDKASSVEPTTTDASSTPETSNKDFSSSSADAAAAMPPPSSRSSVIAVLNDTLEERQARIQAILRRHNHPIVKISDAKQRWNPTASGISDDPVDLTDVDDEEIESIVLPSIQAREKEQIWLTLYKDYELEQAHKRNKRDADIQAGIYKEPRKKRKPAAGRSTGGGARAGAGPGGAAGLGGVEKFEDTGVVNQSGNAAAAGMVKKKMFSRKINYNAISNLF